MENTLELEGLLAHEQVANLTDELHFNISIDYNCDNFTVL